MKINIILGLVSFTVRYEGAAGRNTILHTPYRKVEAIFFDGGQSDKATVHLYLVKHPAPIKVLMSEKKYHSLVRVWQFYTRFRAVSLIGTLLASLIFAGVTLWPNSPKSNLCSEHCTAPALKDRSGQQIEAFQRGDVIPTNTLMPLGAFLKKTQQPVALIPPEPKAAGSGAAFGVFGLSGVAAPLPESQNEQ